LPKRKAIFTVDNSRYQEKESHYFLFAAGKYLLLVILFSILMSASPGFSSETRHNFRGFVGAEGQFYFNSPAHSGQENQNASVVLEPDYNYRFENDDQFTIVPFFRWDEADKERTHFDLREFSYIHTQKSWDLRVGVRKEFWGTTEALHLVDIINQTDLIESPAGEQKLGQPMVNLSLTSDWGILDFFVLPYFRERTFPGKKGRLRTSLPVDTDQPIYESSAENWHTDFAVRYFNAFEKMDFGLYQFIGTGREPLFQLGTKGDELVLVPFYEQINQTGLDTLYVTGNWILKFEGIYRDASLEDFFAATGGFEYTFAGIGGTGMDLGVLGEWLYDDRGFAKAIFDKDVALGARLGFNDFAGTTLLAVLIQSIETDRRLTVVEASTRFGNHWRATLEFRGYANQPPSDLLFDVRDDDFLKMRLDYRF
jgi:hypothetical protein